MRQAEKLNIHFFKNLYQQDKVFFFELIIFIFFIFSIPFSESAKTISFVLLALFFIIRHFYKKDFPLRTTPFLYGLIFYLLAGLIISFFAIDVRESLKGWEDILFFSAIYFILLNDFDDKVKEVIEWSLLISTALAVLWGIIVWKLLWDKPYLQIISLGYYNHTAIYLGTIFILSLSKLLWTFNNRNNLKEKILLIFITGFILIGILLSTSRASLLGIACAIIFQVFYKGVNYRYFMYCLLTLLIIASITIYFSRDFQKRIFQVGPVKSRVHIWQAGIKAFQDYPITGVGLRCFGKIDDRYYGKYVKDKVDHAHNLFINNLVQMGIIGFIALIYLLYTAYKTAQISENNHRKLAVYSTLVFVITNGIFNTTLRWEHAIAFVILVFLLDLRDINEKEEITVY